MAVAIQYIAPTKFARYTVADGTGIAKGTLLKLTSPNTAAAASADDDICAGIAMFEKVASDGSTEITAALDGVWGISCSAAGITVGNQVSISGADEVKIFTTLDHEVGRILGRALQTTAGGEVIKVRLNI